MIGAKEPTLESSEASALGLEALSTLADESRLFQDPRFLAHLHSDLRLRLDEQCTAATLLQVGFYHGLRDATLLLRQGFFEERRDSNPNLMRLPITFLPGSVNNAAGNFELRGTWPRAFEAKATQANPRTLDLPSCSLSTGYTSGWLSGIHESEILAIETECTNCGETNRCSFVAQETTAWHDAEHPEALQLLNWLDYDVLSRLVGESFTPEDSATHSESNSPIIHIWGPVMIIPFSGAEESVRAVDLIGSNREARQVSVVVIDCTGTILDEGFGAVAVERILDAAETWRAECIITGLSPLSEQVIADMERPDLLILKDLGQAISTGFQIANSQCCPV